MRPNIRARPIPKYSLEYELMWIFIFITVALIPFCICWSCGKIEVFGNCSGQEGQLQRNNSADPYEKTELQANV